VNETKDAIVIGAGVVGVATAYALARRGWAVTIIDQADGPARGASFANGGQLSYAYTDALASAAMLRKLPMLALGGDPSFRIRRPFDPEFLDWGIRFLGNCSDARFRDNTLAGLALALESRKALDALLERHPFDFGHAAAGKMHLFYDRAAFDSARKVMALKQREGAQQEAMSLRDAARIEPALARASDVTGVIYSRDDAVGDPFRFTAGLLGVLERCYGVKTRFGFTVQRLEIAAGRVRVANPAGETLEAARLAVCAGVGAPRLLNKLGLSAPVWPMKGYSFTAPLGAEAPRVSITDTARKVVFCRLSGQMRVAGLAELGARDASVDPERLATLVACAQAALPAAAAYASLSSQWAGLRPMSPSSLPIIARPRPELVTNIGHGMLGWTFAMGAAERAADLFDPLRP
jgi:D-amino-acid dehydrogenase